MAARTPLDDYVRRFQAEMVPAMWSAVGLAAVLSLAVLLSCACVCRYRHRRREAAERARALVDEVRGFQKGREETVAGIATMIDLQDQARDQLNTLRREEVSAGGRGRRPATAGSRGASRPSSGRGMY